MPKYGDKESKQRRDRIRCIQMRRNGKAVKLIAKKCKRSESWVKKWSYLTFERAETQPKSGRPLKLTEKSKEAISKLRKSKRGSCRKVEKFLRRNKIQKVCRTTILRFKKRTGNKWYKRKKVPALSPKNIEDRKAYCSKFGSKHRLWWDNVLFTDETYFGLSEKINSHNDGVWCERAEDVPPVTKVKNDDKRMVWGGFSSRGVTKLVWFKKGERMNARKYMRQVLIPVCKDIKKRKKKCKNLTKTRLFRDLDDFYFQQDGATCHIANKCQRWLNNSANIPHFINKEDWPGNSPDLNPIENLWSIMFEKVYEKGPFKNISTMKSKVERVWKDLDVKTLENLARSSKKRCAIIAENPSKKAPY